MKYVQKHEGIMWRKITNKLKWIDEWLKRKKKRRNPQFKDSIHKTEIQEKQRTINRRKNIFSFFLNWKITGKKLN